MSIFVLVTKAQYFDPWVGKSLLLTVVTELAYFWWNGKQPKQNEMWNAKICPILLVPALNWPFPCYRIKEALYIHNCFVVSFRVVFNWYQKTSVLVSSDIGACIKAQYGWMTFIQVLVSVKSGKNLHVFFWYLYWQSSGIKIGIGIELFPVMSWIFIQVSISVFGYRLNTI